MYKGLRSLEKLREDLILEGIKAYDDGGRGRERRERGLNELHEVPARTSSLCGAKRYRTDYSETRVPDRVGPLQTRRAAGCPARAHACTQQ